MKETLLDIIQAIKARADKEYEQHKSVRAICRGNINILYAGKLQPRRIWITNIEPSFTRDETYYSDGSIREVNSSTCNALMAQGRDEIVVSKNRTYAQRILQHFDGHHDVVFNKKNIVFDIINSANFTNPPYGRSCNLSDIEIGIAGMKDFMHFKDIETALSKLSELVKKQKAAADEEEAAQKRLKEIEEQRRQAEIERQKKLKEARDAEEKRRIEEEQKRLEEEHQKELERRRKAEEERKQFENEIAAMADKYATAASFIRKEASLRLNPRLSAEQNDIKFSNVLDGTTVVINGGPGTGKTTTLIQRLKLLISKEDLYDYRDNHDDCGLSDEQIEIASNRDRNWIFFSPTELLRQFLTRNMEYEGLTQPNSKTLVWSNYLKQIVRDKYQFAGDDFPFDFAKLSLNQNPIFTGNHTTLINRFIREYINEMKKKLQRVAEIDTSQFKWHQMGKRIADICKGAEKRITATSSLVRILMDLDELRERPVPAGVLSVKQVVSQYKDKMQYLSTSYISEWRKDKEFYASLLEMAKSWKNNNLTEEEEEEAGEMDEGEVVVNAESKLLSELKTLMKKMALRTIDNKVTLPGRTKQLFDKVGDRIIVADYEGLAEYAFFMQYFNPVIQNYESYLFGKITSIYKRFRREALKTNMPGWNKKLLKQIVEEWKNRPLCQQEQALLIGFINNLVLSIRSVSVRRFDALKHKYAEAYKDVCRPVIGVDEATDYTLVDYYAINSLRHYKVSSFTLTGDMMQGMRLDGIKDWKDLQKPILFNSVEVKNLTISYRLSPKLMRLADAIYEHEMATQSPYKCKLEQDESCPEPLLLESDDEEEKARWIAKRVLEVKRKYSFVPSIAVFVADKNDAANLESLLIEDGRLDNNGIEVKDCSSGDNLSAQDIVRIFPLDKVKGMEFEVVFFHNIDKVKASKLISHYLYVGLSRATFFMGITTSSTDVDTLKDIIDEFDTTGTWGEE